MEPVDTKLAENESSNLDYWMSRALREWDRACDDFAPEPVHDLRVALRRCRSIADGFMVFDPHPGWKLMKREGRQLFRQLGALRDTQVMMEWVWEIAPAPDETSVLLHRYLVGQELQHKESAAEALQDFNRKKWASWTRLLSSRAQRIPSGSLAFQHLALERWSEAHALHKAAMRNRSHASYHKLRIALKKFRYTVENFMPERYAAWGTELGDFQDILGEMHDLHVLWQTALTIKAFPNEDSHSRWRLRISDAIHQRLERYRKTMLGKESRWYVWRADLPQPDHLGMAALARLRAWASFRDPDFAHSAHVARLALQIYDGLESLGLTQDANLANTRFMLEAAALAHDTGIWQGDKKHQLASYRLIRKIAPSPGLDAESLRMIALLARFHQGPLPRSEQKAFSGIPAENLKAIFLLCGILRLADAFDWRRKKRIRHLTLTRSTEILRIHAPGYEEDDASAEKLSAARHLLETSCALPIAICPL
ncbi:MAG TPA: CHAD domain-containing protein [Acidobacteriota bacterium]|nr:CHAD domain-containing protein [Acidobacteriota bacterium]